MKVPIGFLGFLAGGFDPVKQLCCHGAGLVLLGFLLGGGHHSGKGFWFVDG